MSNFYIKKPIPIQAVQMSESFEVETLEGTMKGKAGDYLITGVTGEKYPCDKGIFEMTYEPVSSPVYPGSAETILPEALIGAVALGDAERAHETLDAYGVPSGEGDMDLSERIAMFADMHNVPAPDVQD